MPDKPQQNHLQEWLEQLQRDSWNLELLVSGFSIFLLFGAIEKLQHVFGNIWVATGYPNSINFIINFFVSVLFFGAITLLVNLLIHILLRGFWIGAVGLRSINTEIPVEKLNYTPRFTQFLQGKLPRLDTLLEQLDRVCSGIFAFAFLVALMFLSLFLYVGVSIVVVSVINNLTTILPAFMDLPLRSIAAILTIIWLVMGLLYFLDTLTLGYFKRLRYNRLYFMIYRITSWCSGSFLYRALYYHLITNFPRRFIQGFLAFFILILISLPFVKLDYFRFFPDTPEETLLSAGFYDELRSADHWIRYASIPSLQVEGDFLPVFIRYDPDANTEIAAGCDYTPSKAGGLISGIEFKGGFKIHDPQVTEKDPAALLRCLSSYYTIYIDSLLMTGQTYYFAKHPAHGQPGLQTVLDLKQIPAGHHQLRISCKEKGKEVPYTMIPFWKGEDGRKIPSSIPQ